MSSQRVQTVEDKLWGKKGSRDFQIALPARAPLTLYRKMTRGKEGRQRPGRLAHGEDTVPIQHKALTFGIAFRPNRLISVWARQHCQGCRCAQNQNAQHNVDHQQRHLALHNKRDGSFCRGVLTTKKRKVASLSFHSRWGIFAGLGMS